MRLNTLGVLELLDSDFSEEKPLLLLAYLAHNAADGWLPSERAAALVWPDSQKATNSLNQAVHTLYKHAGARQHIRRRSRGIRVSGVETDAQALVRACDEQDIVALKRLYGGGQFLQTVNPDAYPELYNEWILPEQKRLQAGVWTTYLDALVARPDNVAERLSEAYVLTSVLPEPDSHDFRRCVCLQRLFGEKNGHFARLLQQEIDDLNIAPLPATDEEARAFLGLPREGLPEFSIPERLEDGLATQPSQPEATSRVNRFRFAALSLLGVLLVAAGFSVWRLESVTGSERQVVSTVSDAVTDKTRLDIPVATQVLETLPDVEDAQVALLLAAEAAHGLQPVAAGGEATEGLRERLLAATEPWGTRLEHNVLYLDFSPDGRWLLVAGEDPVAQVWNMQGGPDEPSARLQHGDNVSTAGFTENGDYLMTGSGDGTGQLWSVDDFTRPVHTFDHESMVTNLAKSPDGRWLATGTLEGKVRLWSLENTEASPAELKDHVGWVTPLAFSPDGSLLFTGDDRRGIHLYRLTGDDTAPASEAVTLLEASTIRFGQELPLVISPDGRWAAAGRPDSAVHLFDLADPENEQKILQGHRDHVQSLLFSRDGRWLASGSRDGDVRVWSMTGNEVGTEKYVLEGHEGWVMTLTLSPDGRYLLSGSDDATVRAWDMALDPPDVRVFSDHPHQVRAVALSPQGWMATGSYEGDALIQNLERRRQDLTQAPAAELLTAACKVAGRNLTQDEWERFVGETPYRPLCS